jgi:hypothetical protein
MIIKFCYQNEIHRCSDPPSDFLLLKSFLVKMFQVGLPRNFVLSYVNPEGETLPLNSKEDYEALQSKEYNKPVKVVITEVKEDINDDQMSDYEMMGEKPEELVEDKPEKEVKDLLEEITEEVTKVHVFPQVQKLEGEIPQEEQVRRIVRETLEEQMPFIMARLKEDASIQESLKSDVPEQKKPHQSFWNQIGLYPYYQSILQSIPDEMKVAQSQAQVQEEKIAEVPEVPEVVKENNEHEQEEVEERKEGKPSPKLLTKVKKAFVEFPMKAADFVDNLTHKISGDPYVECAEGKYPKSVVEKVESLKEVFEDADKKEMLDFVSKLPKDIPLFQIGDLFAIHKQME